MATAAKMAETKPRGDTDIVAIFILLCNGCGGVRVFCSMSQDQIQWGHGCCTMPCRAGPSCNNCVRPPFVQLQM